MQRANSFDSWFRDLPFARGRHGAPSYWGQYRAPDPFQGPPTQYPSVLHRFTRHCIAPPVIAV